jgi:ABC-type lipoprotein export system ATPase subunit
MRKKVQQRLALALSMAEDPATVFCVHPFSTVEGDGGEKLGRLLARVMNDPEHSLLVATDNAFVFAFGEQVGALQAVPVTSEEVSEATP